LVYTFNIIDEPDNKPKLTMDIEIYCINDMGLFTYYPPQHYEFDEWKLLWILTATSKKPYWEYGVKPEWVEDI
jgi:hypothetical protein